MKIYGTVSYFYAEFLNSQIFILDCYDPALLSRSDHSELLEALQSNNNIVSKNNIVSPLRRTLGSFRAYLISLSTGSTYYFWTYMLFLL